MGTRLLFLLFAALAISLSRAAEPTGLRLQSGLVVPVLSIRKTTLHESNEVALVLTYQTKKDFSNMKSIGSEIEQVWLAFKPFAEQAQVGAAVVVASEPPVSFGLYKSSGIVWKKGNDGVWVRPTKGDRARLPRG